MTARIKFQWLLAAAIATLGLSACAANPVTDSVVWLLDQLKYVADIVACLFMLCLVAFLLIGLPYIGKWRDVHGRHREHGRWG